MAAINEIAAQIMEHLCSHDWHGYTQGNRWGDGEYEALEIDGKKYTIAQGDRDCSSAIISAQRLLVRSMRAFSTLQPIQATCGLSLLNQGFLNGSL